MSYFSESLGKQFLAQLIARILQCRHDLQTPEGEPQYHSLQDNLLKISVIL